MINDDDDENRKPKRELPKPVAEGGIEDPTMSEGGCGAQPLHRPSLLRRETGVEAGILRFGVEIQREIQRLPMQKQIPKQQPGPKRLTHCYRCRVRHGGYQRYLNRPHYGRAVLSRYHYYDSRRSGRLNLPQREHRPIRKPGPRLREADPEDEDPARLPP